MDALIRDIRYALRSFSRSPGLTAVLLVTLAVGTGANATVFSFVDALLFRPADRVVDPSRVAEIFTSDYSSGPFGNSSYPDYLSMRAGVSSFEQLAAFDDGGLSAIKVGDEAERARASRITADYFGLLGVKPGIGRLIGPADVAQDAPRVAVVGYDLWKRAFGLNPQILGQQIVVNGQSYGIVGVTPERFVGVDLGRRMDVWIPLVPPENRPEERENRGFRVLGRLKDGATIAGARAELNVLADKLGVEYPGTNMGTRDAPRTPRPMTAVPHARLDPDTRSGVGLLSAVILGATALVLLIACANVASLLLSRATTRGPEMAVRLALGASRGHLIRQLLTESLIVAAGGGALGILFSLWTVGALPSFFPPEIAQLLDARVDPRVFAFTFAIALASGLVFGLVPALQTRRSTLTTGFRGQSGVTEDSRAGTRTRNVMVVMQVALSGVLVVSTGLLTRSLSNAWRADLGYAARNVAVANVQLPPGEFTLVTGPQYFQQLTEQVRRLPGVEAAGLVNALPLFPGGRRGFRFDGYERQPNEDMEMNLNVADAAYFSTMRVPLVAGRFFDDRDTATSGKVIVVNDVLASRFYGGNAVGRFATDSQNARLEIVGVVRTG
ncbi:MAG TPA: ABC transporter permease, partial [Vicinamibacterales bacterium]